MGRWEPNARERLAKAAMELYAERGYDQTTVAGIAERAGLTERTFFRHYADKREVLFAGAGDLEELFTRAIADAPADAAPVDALMAGIDAVSETFTGRRAFARQRQALIAANAELRERELIKLATLTAALTGALRQRGVAEPAARLAAEAGIAVFKVGFEHWVAPGEERGMAQLMRESLDALKAVTAGGRPG
jgi:AcrR family transcriptional regulator